MKTLYFWIIKLNRKFDGPLAFNSKRHVKFLSLNNRPCQAIPALVNINSDEPRYYPLIANVNKLDGVFNTIDDPYSGACAPDKVKNVNM